MTIGNDAIIERLVTEITAPLSAAGFDLEAVELSPAGKRRMLRIAVDKDGGITLDDVADATRAINEILDESPVMGETPYTLEVTSRGVDRPLTLERHWRRNLDRLVKVTPVNGAAFSGRITSHTADAVVLEVAGRSRTIAFDEIERAMVQIEFNRPVAKKGDQAADEADEELLELASASEADLDDSDDDLDDSDEEFDDSDDEFEDDESEGAEGTANNDEQNQPNEKKKED